MEAKPNIEPQSENSGTKTYDVEGKKLTLYWKKYEPQPYVWHGEERFPPQEEPGKKSAVIFHTGWAIPAQGFSSSLICQDYANFNGTPAIAVEVRGDPRTIKQMQSAEATRQFIVENGFTDLTVAGNSFGGVRAADTVALLEEKNPEINIKGLILIASMGLTEQNKEDFFTRFFNDPGGKVLQKLARHPIKNRHEIKHSLRLLAEVGRGFLKDVKEARGDIPGGVENQRSEMIATNPANMKIKSPIVLLEGEGDLMSNPNLLLPDELGAKAAKKNIGRRFQYRKQTQSEDTTQNSIQDGLTKPEMNQQDEKLKGIISQREVHLKETLFPNSDAIRIIIADANKSGDHSLLGYRWESAARASIGALSKLNRRTKNKMMA